MKTGGLSGGNSWEWVSEKWLPHFWAVSWRLTIIQWRFCLTDVSLYVCRFLTHCWGYEPYELIGHSSFFLAYHRRVYDFWANRAICSVGTVFPQLKSQLKTDSDPDWLRQAIYYRIISGVGRTQPSPCWLARVKCSEEILGRLWVSLKSRCSWTSFPSSSFQYWCKTGGAKTSLQVIFSLPVFPPPLSAVITTTCLSGHNFVWEEYEDNCRLPQSVYLIRVSLLFQISSKNVSMQWWNAGGLQRQFRISTSTSQFQNSIQWCHQLQEVIQPHQASHECLYGLEPTWETKDLWG